jgi:hypothetical protein
LSKNALQGETDLYNYHFWSVSFLIVSTQKEMVKSCSPVIPLPQAGEEFVVPLNFGCLQLLRSA